MRRGDQRGLSLAEVLVAVTILALAMTIALMLYDGARKAFKKGENVIDQQQVVRIAFDMLASDLRMAGFNHNPDGDVDRPDEQIEAAYGTAVVIRADLDAYTADATTPEDALVAAGIFDAVSTGNDEIVAYALAKPDNSSPAEVVYWADVAGQTRDGAVEEVRIQNIALVQDDPPYTLYRFTLNPDAGVVKTPLAENIRFMRFNYFDQAGVEVPPPGGGEADADLQARSAIRRIAIELEGLTRDPDLDWTDPSDADPDTQRHRKFMLDGEIIPRNLGMRGLSDLYADITPPQRPALPRPWPGHCEGLYVTWTPNPVEDGVAYYRVYYGVDASTPGISPPTGSAGSYLDSLLDDTDYYVRVEAVDGNGNRSLSSDVNWVRTNEATRPKYPLNPTATVDVEGSVDLSWDPVTENLDPVLGDPASPAIRDLEHYRIYRGTLPGQLLDDDDLLATTVETTFSDDATVPCQEYYYLIEAADACDARGTPPTTMMGKSDSSVQPAAPTGTQAFFETPSTGRIVWDPVTRDVDGTTIHVDTYSIFHSPIVSTNALPPINFFYHRTVTLNPGDPTAYVDVDIVIPPGQTNYYKVTAVDDCPNESDRSAAAAPLCAFNGSLTFVTPLDDDDPAGPVPITVEVINPGSAFTELVLDFVDESDGSTQQVTLAQPGPIWTYPAWDGGGRPHTITATVTTDLNCSSYKTIRVGPAP